MAVDANGDALKYNGTSWSTPIKIQQDGYQVSSISCVSTSFCMAVDYYGNAIEFDGSSWSIPLNIDSVPVHKISCANSSFCVAVDVDGNYIKFENGSWTSPNRIDQHNVILSISCTSSTFCIAGDYYGNAIEYNGISWSTKNINYGNYLNSISCTSSTFCMAVGNGYAVRYGIEEVTQNNGGGSTKPGAPNTGLGSPVNPSKSIALIIILLSSAIGLFIFFKNRKSIQINK